MHSGERWRLGHRPALDGLRAIAVAFVLAAHFGTPGVFMPSGPGNIGVTIFFTLSGFLITALLLQEHAASGTIRRGAFYVRRFRRLAPALITAVIFGLSLERVVTGTITDWEHAAAALTYTTNFLFAFQWSADPTVLGATWSLGVEEQFYLVWPLAVMLLVRLTRRQGLIVLAGLSLAGPILRLLLWDAPSSGVRDWMGPDTRSDSLLIGCALAVALHESVRRQPAPGWLATAVLVPLALLVPLNASQHTIVVWFPLVTAVLTAVAVCVIATRETVPMLGSTLMRWVGTRSYGIYLYHGPVAVLMRHTDWGLGQKWLFGLPVALGVAELSYRFVEQPFRRSRRPVELARRDRRREVEGSAGRLPNEDLDVVGSRQE